MLRSRLAAVSATATLEMAWLNGTPYCIAVYASQPPSPDDHATLATGVR